MSAYTDFEEERIKHLELIQGVISRLGNDGFLMKGWALTVTGVFLGFAVDKESWPLALTALVPTATFWGLDAYFLRCERLFRCLYSRVRAMDESIEPFFMAATGAGFIEQASKLCADVVSWWKTLWSGTLRAFYGSMVIASFLVLVLIICQQD
jgi:hypothetical protein